MEINSGLLDFTQHLVSISDFSRGKTAQLFDDVKNNDTEYVVLKNNQPTAMVISLDTYKTLVEKAVKMERLLDHIEEERLLTITSERIKNTDDAIDLEMVAEAKKINDGTTVSLDELLKKDGLTYEDLQD